MAGFFYCLKQRFSHIELPHSQRPPWTPTPSSAPSTIPSVTTGEASGAPRKWRESLEQAYQSGLIGTIRDNGYRLEHGRLNVRLAEALWLLLGC